MGASAARPPQRDVFISHASEDKDAVARPLATELRRRGLSVWFDEFELVIGDSLRERIDKGLAQSRVGAVILSEAFFAKEWSKRELDGLTAREMSGEHGIVLPVWHGIDEVGVAKHSPPLAGKFAANSADGVSAVAGAIVRALERRAAGERPDQIMREAVAAPPGAREVAIPSQQASPSPSSRTAVVRRRPPWSNPVPAYAVTATAPALGFVLRPLGVSGGTTALLLIIALSWALQVTEGRGLSSLIGVIPWGAITAGIGMGLYAGSPVAYVTFVVFAISGWIPALLSDTRSVNWRDGGAVALVAFGPLGGVAGWIAYAVA